MNAITSFQTYSISIYNMWIFLLFAYAASLSQEECLNQLNNLEIEIGCIKLLTSKVLGYSLVIISVVLKFPQIAKILKNKSVEGISLTSFYFETLVFSISAAYGIHQKMPLNTFGEHVFISFQCLTQVLLFWHYGKVPVSNKIKALVFFFGLWVPSMFSELFPTHLQISVPERFWTYIPIYVMTMNAIVKLSQIKTNYSNGSTGNLSFITNFLNTYGTICRIVTTLVELSDVYLLVCYLAGFTWNLILMVQFWVYWNVKTTKKD